MLPLGIDSGRWRNDHSDATSANGSVSSAVRRRGFVGSASASADSVPMYESSNVGASSAYSRPAGGAPVPKRGMLRTAFHGPSISRLNASVAHASHARSEDVAAAPDTGGTPHKGDACAVAAAAHSNRPATEVRTNTRVTIEE